MLTCLRLATVAILCASAAMNANAEASPEDLWSLYVYEQAASVCGFELTEDEETELDDAQHRMRLRLSLSPQQAAELYRKARAMVAAAKEDVCRDAVQSQLGLKAALDRAGQPG